MQLYSASEMVAVDRHAIDVLGMPGVVLMENAGRACAHLLADKLHHCFPGPVLVVAGKGNNGGDGYVVARTLADRGWQVITLVLAAPEDISGDAAVMLKVLEQCDQDIVFAADARQLQQAFAAQTPALIVDAVFGTGLKADVQGLPAEAIELVNQAAAPVVAIDIPSGIDASTGRVCGCVVKADLTVSFDHAKIGHISQPGARYIGNLEVVDIGIPLGKRPAEVTPRAWMIDITAARGLLPVRPAFGHKGHFGHLLVVAGSTGKTGAAALSGDAAVRSGCGLVTVAVPASLHGIMEIKLTEAMTLPLSDEGGCLCFAAYAQIVRQADSCQALALGPGLGQSDDLRRLVRELVCSVQQPVIVDADGLNLLAGQLECLVERRGNPLILTPHPGEMARLTGLSVAEIEADRYRVARDFACRYQVVLLLKGARTLVAAPDGRVHIHITGNSGLSSGGSGDVLTGIIGGLLAQGLGPFAAASLAAWWHGRAAEQIAAHHGPAGMAASDLIRQLPLVRKELEQSQERDLSC